jgi:hypothetical protein
MTSIAVLHWPVRKHYLISGLAPGVDLVPVVPGEPAADAVARILGGHLSGHGHLPELVLVHIDSSTPADFVRTLDDLQDRIEATGIAVWNGGVASITKRSIQTRLADAGLPTTLALRDGDAAEKVIVKTNLNSRGIPEWEMPDEHRAALGWAPRAASPLDGKDGYLVMQRAEVPAPWWDDPQAIIERYVDNRYGVFYRVYFVGEQVVVCEGRASTQVRRMRDAHDRYDLLLDRHSAVESPVETLVWQPAFDAFLSAVACAELLSLDYGTIDLVVDDRGIPYVVDVNTTPFWGIPEGPDDMLRHLRMGLP